MSSPAASPARLRRSERREAILDAAAGLVTERAIDAISMTDVVRVAGVSRPVVYDHFASTRDLVVALVERHRGALRAALDDHAAAHGPVADEAGFRAVLALIFDQFEADPAGWRLLSQEPSSDPAIAEVQRVGRDEINRAIAHALALEGPPRARMLVAEAIRTAANGLFAWGKEHASVRRGQLVDAFVSVAWRGIGTDR